MVPRWYGIYTQLSVPTASEENSQAVRGKPFITTL